MRRLATMARWTAGLAPVLLAATGLWLYLAPPALIQVGSAYAAKIVCSNVFIAGRAAGAVLERDMQAPGNPLLRLMRARVDRENRTVRTGLLGVFGRGLAVHRPGLGCTVVPGGEAVPPALRPARPAAAGRKDAGPGTDDARDAQDGRLAAILDDERLTGPGMRAVVVMREGRIVAERYGAAVNDPLMPLLGWSMTKTVTAAIVGTVAATGRLSATDDALRAAWRGDARADITIADLMGMQSGLAFNESYGSVTDVTRMLYLEEDMAGFVAGKELVDPVGAAFRYSSGTSVLLSRIWQDRFADAAAARAWPRAALFGPLGMDTAVLETDMRGTFVGSSNMYASARDWARFGQFLLQDGVWRGRRILPQGWVEWMCKPTRASGGEYGRGVWLHGPRVDAGPPDAGFELPDDAYWMLGHDGQTVTVIPSRRMVVARLGLTPTRLGYKPQALVEALVAWADDRPGRAR